MALKKALEALKMALSSRPPLKWLQPQKKALKIITVQESILGAKTAGSKFRRGSKIQRVRAMENRVEKV